MIGLSLLLTLGSVLIGWCFEILTPRERAIFREEFISVVVKVDPATVQEIRIVTEEESLSLKVDEKREVYCKSVRIVPGENLITVKAVSKDGKSQERTVPVFMVSQVFADGNVPPEGFKVTPFHTAKGDALCADCHKMEGMPEQEICGKCHGKILTRKVPHPPSVGSCTLCHTGGGADGSKYAWREPISETCYMCHGDKKQIWFSKKYMHGPPSTGKCYICHNPHSEDVRFFLKKQTNDLCTTCHSEKSEEKHPLVGFVFGNAHPISGKPDPARPGFELSCTGCHNPHASNYRFFFQNDYSGEAILCLRCHKK